MTTQRRIERDELKEMLDRGDDFKLVMVLGEWGFHAKHIPGSLNLSSPSQVPEMLDPKDDMSSTELAELALRRRWHINV